MEIRGKTALVTGGAVRVGQAISKGLAKAGARVVVHYNRSREEAERTVAEITASAGEAYSVQGDFTRTAEITRAVADCVASTGRLDILINSAASYLRTPIGHVTEQQWDDQLALNLKAPFFCAQAAAKFMQEQGSGKIVNIADVAGISPWPEFIPYSASKAGLISLTQGLAKALAPNIQVNAIASGTVLIREEASDDHAKRVVEQTLLKRIGSPEDIVNTLLFLLEGSDYVTGAIIAVDGGKLLA